MASVIPLRRNVCVKHNDTNIRGVVVKDVIEKDENIIVLTEKIVEETWPKNKITTISSSDLKCHKIKNRIASAERYGISLGGKRRTRRYHKLLHRYRKYRKTRRHH